MSTDADSATTRREVLQRAAALGLTVGTFGSLGVAEALAAVPKPKRGGTLRVGLPGGPASTDNLDPHLEGVAGFAQAYLEQADPCIPERHHLFRVLRSFYRRFLADRDQLRYA